MDEGRVSNRLVSNCIKKTFDDSALLEIVRDGFRQLMENRHQQEMVNP